HTGAHVDDRGADAHGRLAGLAGDTHQAAERLHERIVAGPLRERTAAPEGADAAIDKALVARAQGSGVEAKFLDHPGTQVLDQHVGAFLDQALELRALALVAQVDGDRELVAVETLEDRRDAMPKGRCPLARVIAAVALLDLDHRGAEVGEDFGRVRRGDAVPKLDDGDVGERRSGSHGSPGVLTPSRYTPDPNPT